MYAGDRSFRATYFGVGNTNTEGANSMSKTVRSVVVFSACLAVSLIFPATGVANDPMPPSESLERAFPKKTTFSPYAGRNFPTQVLWGDTHVHTELSMDAGAFGARLGPEDAYRFAKGEEVVSSTGLPVRLSRPLDFLVVADHSDNMGFFPRLLDGDPAFLADPTGRRWYEMIQKGGQDGVQVAVEVIRGFSQNTFPKALASIPGTSAYRDTWDRVMDAAEASNDPGHFTAFIGYEWTSNTKGNNLHRVVVYRDGKTKASMLEPFTTLKPHGSDQPRDLWKWLARYEEKTGGRILAIAHNGNLSNGIMFPRVEPGNIRKIKREYADLRARWEPLYEATQIKGDGETHAMLSPDDEFADYETWDQGNLDLSVAKEDAMLEYEYARSALAIGMEIEERVGTNPYKFGMIGSTDTHTALATAQEDNFFGKHSGAEPSPERWKHPMAKVGDKSYESYDMVASGLAGVWARENTREAIFDAMMRKETYATTGSRMLLRFFGAWDFNAEDAKTRLPANVGYAKGVPMGADLAGSPEGRSPSFMVAALRDPISGNLDRIQIVKVSLDKKRKRIEKVYDVAWGGDRKLDAEGKLPALESTVNVAEATWTNTTGSPELIGVWVDPDFDPSRPAAYYARALEIETPRWTAYEAKRFNLDFPSKIPMTNQERAYSSPIWYTPTEN
jgi:hypothetical protein